MLFSIIVPVYNAQDHLAACLESFESQTFGDFEVVLVDDGSTDSSPEMCDEFAIRRQYVKVIHISNGGPLVARRVAIRESNGKYLVPVDSDDVLHADALSYSAHLIESYNPDIIAFGFSTTSDFAVNKSTVPLKQGLYVGKQYSLIHEAVCSGTFNNLCTKVFRRECVSTEDNKRARTGMMFAEDWLEVLGIISNARSLYYIDKSLYFYRPNPSSTVHTYRRQYAEQLATVLRVVDKMAVGWGEHSIEAAQVARVTHTFSLMQSIQLSSLRGSQRQEAYQHLRNEVDLMTNGLRWGMDRISYQRIALIALRFGWVSEANLLVTLYNLIAKFLSFGAQRRVVPRVIRLVCHET